MHRPPVSLLPLCLIWALAGCPVQALAAETPVNPNSSVDEEAFNPLHAHYGVQTPVTSQGFELRVVLPAEGKNTRVVAKSPQGESRRFDLSDQAAQVRKMWVVEGRLVVVSSTGGSSCDEVATFDLATGKTIDTFWAWSPAASPDGRRIAFELFYPAHFTQGTESQYRLYDVLASPTDNRPSYRRNQPNGSDGFEPSDPVGTAVYPLSPKELGRRNVLVPERRAHQSVSKLVWSPDGRNLAFVDAVGRLASLVVVDTTAAIRPGAVPTSSVRIPQLEVLCTVRSFENCVDAPPHRIQWRFDRDAIVVTAQAESPLSVTVPRQRLRAVPQARYGDAAD